MMATHFFVKSMSPEEQVECQSDLTLHVFKARVTW